MAELFGFKITRSGQDGGSDGFTAPASDDGTLDVISGGGHYASVLDLDGRDTSDIELINCHNDCQTLVIKHYPKVANLLSWLLEYAPSRMTGTGACIFTQFNSKAEALLIQSKLPSGIQSFVAKGINESPLLEELKALRDTTKLFK